MTHILQQKTVASPVVEEGTRCLSMIVRMSLHILQSSSSTFCRYSLISLTLFSFPLDSSFCSIEDMIRQEARLAPITFLYPTERRFLSSTVNSTSSFASFFMHSTISEKPMEHDPFRRDANLSTTLQSINSKDYGIIKIITFGRIFHVLRQHQKCSMIHTKSRLEGQR